MTHLCLLEKLRLGTNDELVCGKFSILADQFKVDMVLNSPLGENFHHSLDVTMPTKLFHSRLLLYRHTT